MVCEFLHTHCTAFLSWLGSSVSVCFRDTCALLTFNSCTHATNASRMSNLEIPKFWAQIRSLVTPPRTQVLHELTHNWQIGLSMNSDIQFQIGGQHLWLDTSSLVSHSKESWVTSFKQFCPCSLMLHNDSEQAAWIYYRKETYFKIWSSGAINLSSWYGSNYS